MKSLRAHAIAASCAIGLLAASANAQMYGVPSGYQAAPAAAYSGSYAMPAPSYVPTSYGVPVYSNTSSYNHGQNAWSYPQTPATQPAPLTLSSLIGPPATATPDPAPQMPSQLNAQPSPSDAPAYGAPVQPYSPMNGYSTMNAYSAGASCGGTGYDYGSAGYGAAGYGCGSYGGYGYDYGASSCMGSSAGIGLGSQYGAGRGHQWFGGAYGMFMTRDRENDQFFSFDTNAIQMQHTNARDANFDIAGGVGVHVGRYFNCGRSALQGIYWGVIPDDSGSAFPDAGRTVTLRTDVTGTLWGIHNWNNLTYNGSPADEWVNGPGGSGAEAHSVWRDNQFHNVEINFLSFLGCDSSCNAPRWNVNWLLGARYFNFKDEMLFGADTTDGNFTFSDPTEIYYYIMTNNHLIGFQVGADGAYCITPRLWMDFTVKAGIFGNNIVHDSVIGGSAGDAVINDGPYAGRSFVVQNSDNDVSMVGELDFGFHYYFNCRWKAMAGYRFMGVSGVALPTNQIYPDLRGLNDVEVIDSNGSLILHGGYAGIEYNY